MAGTLFVVATPIGNLEDISARALRVLREVTLIAAEDTRHTGHLLQRFGLTTRTTSFHEHSEKGKAVGLIERLRAGDSIALVSDAGTPTVSDPGVHLVRLAREAGIRVEPIPGPSAITAALSVSGFPADTFTFLGFPPNKGKERRAWFDKFEAASKVVSAAVFYEAPHRVELTMGELRSRFGNLTVMVARELTKAHEQVQICTLDNLDLSQSRGEFTVVVDFGQMPSHDAVVEVSAALVASEFGEITKHSGLTRRQAVAALSRKYGLQARVVYAMIEAGKESAV
jgi:16S rRNA (cytidine1402-2'-O)-methyltransferase